MEILTQIPLKLIEQIKLNKDIEDLNNGTIKVDLITILINITSAQDTIHVQVHTEHLTKLIIWWSKQISTLFKVLK